MLGLAKFLVYLVSSLCFIIGFLMMISAAVTRGSYMDYLVNGGSGAEIIPRALIGIGFLLASGIMLMFAKDIER